MQNQENYLPEAVTIEKIKTRLLFQALWQLRVENNGPVTITVISEPYGVRSANFIKDMLKHAYDIELLFFDKDGYSTTPENSYHLTITIKPSLAKSILIQSSLDWIKLQLKLTEEKVTKDLKDRQDSVNVGVSFSCGEVGQGWEVRKAALDLWKTEQLTTGGNFSVDYFNDDEEVCEEDNADYFTIRKTIYFNKKESQT